MPSRDQDPSHWLKKNWPWWRRSPAAGKGRPFAACIRQEAHLGFGEPRSWSPVPAALGTSAHSPVRFRFRLTSGKGNPIG